MEIDQSNVFESDNDNRSREVVVDGCHKKEIEDIDNQKIQTEDEVDYGYTDENFDDEYDDDYGDEYDDDDYGDEYDEEPCFGDGVDYKTFDTMKSMIFYWITATKRLNGRIEKDAEKYLVSALALCNFEQRKALMKVQTIKHTSLSLACEIGNLRLVKFLVEHCGADVNEFFGWPLYWSIYKKHKNIIQYLVESNADVGMCFVDNCNMLMASLDIYNEGSLTVESGKCMNEIDRIKIVHQNQQVKNTPGTDIVNLLVENDAVRKSSPLILFNILKVFLNDKESHTNVNFKNVLDKISNLDEVKDENGKSILEHAVLDPKLNIVTATMILRKGDVNAVNTLKAVCVPTLEKYFSNLNESIGEIWTNILNEKRSKNISYIGLSSRHCLHPIVYAAYQGNWKLLSGLMCFPNIPLKIKLDAVEIYGAFLVIKYLKFADALLCWNVSTEMRLGKHEISSLHPFSPVGTGSELNKLLNILHNEHYQTRKESEKLMKTIIPYQRCAFDFQLEFQSIEDLEYLQLETSKDILIQAGLLYERVIGYGNSFTLAVMLLIAKRYHNEQFLGHLKSSISLVTSSLCFYIQNQMFDKKKPLIVVQQIVKALTLALSSEKLRKQLDFDTIMAILKCIFLVCYKFLGTNTLIKEQITYLLITIYKIDEHEKTPDQTNQFRRCLIQIVKLDIRDSFNQTLLHYSVLIRKIVSENNGVDKNGIFSLPPIRWWLSQFENPFRVTQLLLESGAAPNVFDINGQTPLHTFFLSFESGKDLTQEDKIVLDALLEAGAHQDYIDVWEMTPIDYSEFTCLPLCRARNRTLQCLVSRVILKNGIQFKGELSVQLANFVRSHARHGKLLSNHQEKYMYHMNMIDN
ncbi:uncharacterized protein LOC127701275 [Mytilus californianus]|uniref:uncharacterized protein LOC127701275 n=1 Tax=Mytilus californianus TaxID=6549 RepID=UPI00224546F4|nr:uncharacterized protein LOC127701275 [Mytilus californianus]